MRDSFPLGRMLKKHIPIFAGAFLLALGLMLFSCRSPVNPDCQNMLTTVEKEAGWVLLFNGRNLKGWRGLGLNGIPKGHWVVEGGAIKNVPTQDVPKGKDGKPTRHFDLATMALFEDFELCFEWKVGPGGNSGLKYNVSEEMSRAYAETKNAAIGFEYQILDDTLNPDARLGPHRAAASLYDILPVSGSILKPVGEYNAARILLNGNHGEHWLNGVKVLEYDLGTPLFAARIAASKFKDIPGFAAKRRGHIVLQDHGDAVWFRNIKLRGFGPHQARDQSLPLQSERKVEKKIEQAFLKAMIGLEKD